MTTLKSTSGSLLTTISATATAITNGINGSATWLSTWADNVEERSITSKLYVKRDEAAKRETMPGEIAANYLGKLQDIAKARAKDEHLFDQLHEKLQAIK